MANEPSQADAHDDRLDQVIAAYLRDVDAGRAPDRQELLRRHPDLAAELEEFFADNDCVGQLTQPLRPAEQLTSLYEGSQANGSEDLTSIPGLVGGYRPLRLLGVGGMGRVYEAEDATGRRVALKLISPGFASSPTALARFRQEGQLAGMIAHPRCVFVLTADEQNGQPYIVMELMTGSTLKDLVERQGPLDPADAITKILAAENARKGRVINGQNCCEFGASRGLLLHGESFAGSDGKGARILTEAYANRGIGLNGRCADEKCGKKHHMSYQICHSTGIL